MNNRIIDHIFAALRAAGPDGLSALEVSVAVTESRGRPTSRECVRKLMSERRGATGAGPHLQYTTVKGLQRWVIFNDVDSPPPPPEAEPVEPAPAWLLAWPESLTAALMGDPLPGRSVHDQRQASRVGR